MKAMLTVKNLSHAFDHQAILREVSFTAASGMLTSLVGPSGCGKSTLLRLIAGLEPLQQGDIILGDASIATTAPHLRQVGLVFQHPSLFPHLTVRQNIHFGLFNHSRAAQHQRSDALLKLIQMPLLAERYPHELSGGQQQRVALARAIAPKPRLMLLDEPFANLDHVLRRDIREEVTEILKATQIATVMVTHDPEEALIMADHMVLMTQDGQVHQTGKPDAIHNHPIDANAAAFFCPINRIAGHIRGELIVSALGSLPKASYAPHAKAGQNVTIVTRPEGIRLLNPSEKQTPPTALLEAQPLLKVASMRHTGAGYLVKARYHSADVLRFHHIYGEPPRQGESIAVTFQPPHVMVFTQ